MTAPARDGCRWTEVFSYLERPVRVVEARRLRLPSWMQASVRRYWWLARTERCVVHGETWTRRRVVDMMRFRLVAVPLETRLTDLALRAAPGSRTQEVHVSKHEHIWDIPAPREGPPLGHCKVCGEVKMFDNDTEGHSASAWSRARSQRGLATRYGRR